MWFAKVKNNGNSKRVKCSVITQSIYCFLNEIFYFPKLKNTIYIALIKQNHSHNFKSHIKTVLVYEDIHSIGKRLNCKRDLILLLLSFPKSTTLSKWAYMKLLFQQKKLCFCQIQLDSLLLKSMSNYLTYIFVSKMIVISVK